VFYFTWELGLNSSVGSECWELDCMEWDLVGIPKIEGIYRVDWRENVSESD
jgi:hypothetical protein